MQRNHEGETGVSDWSRQRTEESKNIEKKEATARNE